MQFSIPVFFQVSDNSAEAAKINLEQTLKELKFEGFTMGSPIDMGDKKPNISVLLQRFLINEIEQNDNDPDGYETDLDYCRGSLSQVPSDVLVEMIGYKGGLSPEFLLETLSAELDGLIQKFGGGSKVVHLME